MLMKYVKWTLLGMLSFLILYLGTVWVWANSAAPSLLKEFSVEKPVEKLNPQLIDALIKIEDPSFYNHSGLDISNGQGLTTMTSAVASIVFLGDNQLEGAMGRMQSFYRSVFRCCKRIDFGRDIMALALNSHATKRDQINIYMRNVYLASLNGRRIIGFEDASLTYYQKDLSELTKDEFYGIVAMLLAPNYYHPVKSPKIHAKRLERVRAVVNGQCEPNGWLDLTYDHCPTNA